MIKKHGSEHAVRLIMAERQNKSRETYKGGGGFAYLKETDPEKLKQITAKGGRTSRRTKGGVE